MHIVLAYCDRSSACSTLKFVNLMFAKLWLKSQNATEVLSKLEYLVGYIFV